MKHICNDEGICTICGNEVATSGLIYKLNEDKKSYYVSEYIGVDIDIIIPAKHNGLYVTSIGDSVFSNFIGLTSIKIPDSVTSMGDEAFNRCKAITVYCEVLEKPSGWSEWWNYSNYGNCYVIWGYKRN